MAAKAVDLIPQRFFRNVKIFWLPARPALPEIATAPSGHYEDAVLVSEIVKLLGLKFAFESDRIQAHVRDVTEFVLEPLRTLPQHHVGSPSSAADQNLLAIDLEDSPTGGVHL